MYSILSESLFDTLPYKESITTVSIVITCSTELSFVKLLKDRESIIINCREYCYSRTNKLRRSSYDFDISGFEGNYSIAVRDNAVQILLSRKNGYNCIRILEAIGVMKTEATDVRFTFVAYKLDPSMIEENCLKEKSIAFQDGIVSISQHKDTVIVGASNPYVVENILK